MRPITHIVLHCTATPQSATVPAIRRFWRENLGWKWPGYHWIIKPDGEAVNLLAIDKVSNGVAGHNAHSIHISYIGGIDNAGNAVDNRTLLQIQTMIKFVKTYKEKFPEAIICGHRDFPGVTKECPSFDVKEWLKNIDLSSF